MFSVSAFRAFTREAYFFSCLFYMTFFFLQSTMTLSCGTTSFSTAWTSPSSSTTSSITLARTLIPGIRIRILFTILPLLFYSHSAWWHARIFFTTCFFRISAPVLVYSIYLWDILYATVLLKFRIVCAIPYIVHFH